MTEPVRAADVGSVAPAGISTRLVLLLAVACGLSVANLYYTQPLLHTISESFDVSAGVAGMSVTVGQIGYAIGLALVLPLGDLFNRKRFVPVILVITAASLTATSIAPTFAVYVSLAAVIGVGSVAAQVLIPFASQLAGDHERGRVVGQVMSGLLIGILLARTVSGFIAGATNWRVVYVFASAVTVVLALVLSKALPNDTARPTMRYVQLLRATVHIFATEPLLRRRATFGILGFGSFSAFWTTVAFLLAGGPYDYSDGVIGLFGLIGAAGAVAASFSGGLADRGHSRAASIGFAGAIFASFGALWLGTTSLGWLIVGVILLDVGVQGLQVMNMSLNYTLDPNARSRINSAHMVCYFIGGAAGSAAASLLYEAYDWPGVCALGLVLGGLATLLAVVDRVSPRAA